MTGSKDRMTSKKRNSQPVQGTPSGVLAMYDSIATLKSNKTITFDSYGNEVITYTDRDVFVQPRSVYNSEFYNAAQAGLHPSITFRLTNKADYQGETLIEWDGRLFYVVRTDWTAQRDTIDLICEERINGN